MVTHKLKSPAGVTLIEIMITLVIIGILASLATPRFEAAMSNMKLKSANRDLQSTMRLARSMALADKKQYGVEINPNDMTVTVFRDSLNLAAYSFDSPEDSVIRVDTLPSEITYLFTDCDNHVIIFAPNGTASFNGGGSGGANIITHGYVSGQTVGYGFEIKRATGRIKMTHLDFVGADGG